MCTTASLSSIEKDSITTTRDSFKDCTLTCKIRNQINTKRKEKFHKLSVVILLKNGCSARIFISLSVENILEHVKSISYFVDTDLFQGKFTFICNIYFTAISIIVTLHQIFGTDIFENSYSWLVSKIYRIKLKPEDRLRALKISHWKWRLYAQLFHIRQSLQLSRFYRVSLANICFTDNMCFTDKYLWKTSPNKQRGQSTAYLTFRMEFFCDIS